MTCGLFSAAKAQTAYDDQQNNYNQAEQYSQPAPNAQQYSYNQPGQYAQPTPNVQQGFYYYPDANVYYDINCGRYIYNNGYGWLTVNVLPSGIYLNNAARFMVYHRGPQVWLDNSIHFRNYYRAAYRKPIVAYNNYRHDDFARRDFNRRDFGRDRGFDHNRDERRW